MDRSHKERENGILKRTEHPTAREHLSAFFRHLNKIKQDDEATEENELDDYVNNDSDGVACRLASDLEKIQDEKLKKILDLQKEIFPDVAASVPAMDDVDGDINEQGRYGYTRLMIAAIEGKADEVKSLIAKGADCEITDNWGQTAFDKAYRRGHDAVCRVINPKFVRKEPAVMFDYDNE